MPVVPDEPPWHLKSCRLDTSLTETVKKYHNPELLKSQALALIDAYSYSVNVYTDASKTTDNKTSAAFYVPEHNIEHTARLNNGITIFVAELTAIKLALLWITSTINQTVTIFSDSLSSLKALATGKSTCRPNLILEILNLINSYQNTVTFVWVPSH